LSEDLGKYRMVFTLDRVNELYEEGYKVHTHTVHVYHDDISGRVMSKDQFLMSRSSEKAYDNITNLKDVEPQYADEYLAKGWIIADSWSKLVRVVKKQ